MRIPIGKVLPVLALCFAMSEVAAAREPAMGALASTPPPPAMVANQAEAGWRQNAGLGLRVAFQYGLPGASEVGTGRPGAEIRPLPPVDVAKTSALVLSSLGMLSVMALLRLNRTL